MLFNSFDFAIFLPSVFIIYWIVLKNRLRSQNFFILIVSYIFYGWWDWRFLSLLAFSSLVDFFIGKGLGSVSTVRTRKVLLFTSLSLNLGLLGVFKYFNFFTESFESFIAMFGLQADAITLQVILPVGISFYTFQTLSYTIDVYRKHLEPTSDVISFFAYVSFFPQLVAGPIERATHLLPQFYKKRVFEYQNAVEGVRLILWGFFKKVVIADQCALFVNNVFTQYETATGSQLVLATIFFAFQIYGDFSGYSDIAIGVSKLFGFELMINFKTPYFSRNIAEFWRRWHISLTTWFRDYVYIPLGGNLPSKVVRNTIIVFLVSGFWHGANWTFIMWGLLNAIYFLPLLLTNKNRTHLDVVASGKTLPSFSEVLSMGFTFALTCFAWIFFRSESIMDAFNYIERMVTTEFSLLSVLEIKFYFPIIILFWIIIDWFSRENGINGWVNSFKVKGMAYMLDCAIILMILIFGAFNEQSFIYFQF